MFCFYGTIYTREIIFLRHTDNITNTTKVQGRQAEPRDVYDVISEALLGAIIKYRENQRQQQAQGDLVMLGGRQNDRQSERGPQGL